MFPVAKWDIGLRAISPTVLTSLVANAVFYFILFCFVSFPFYFILFLHLSHDLDRQERLSINKWKSPFPCNVPTWMFFVWSVPALLQPCHMQRHNYARASHSDFRSCACAVERSHMLLHFYNNRLPEMLRCQNFLALPILLHSFTKGIT